jgi:chaperonin GroES
MSPPNPAAGPAQSPPGAAPPGIQSIAALGGAPPPMALQGAGLPMIPPMQPGPPTLPDGVPEAAREHYDMLARWQRSANIADELDAPDDGEMNKMTMRVGQDYEIDERSRVDWRDKYRKWLDFAQQIVEEKTYPWPKASNIVYPLLTTASLQFAARAYPAIIRDSMVVKGKVIGNDSGTPTTDPQTGQPIMTPAGPIWKIAPGAKQVRADLIGRHMSWQLLDEQEEWEPQTDRLLVVLPIVGTMFRKSYFDPALGRNVSETVDAIDMCVNYRAKSFETAPRQTEMVRLYPWEIEERIRSGVFLDKEYGHDMGMTNHDNDHGPPPDQDDDDAAVTFLEQHRRWDLDCDGYAEPYIVTVSRDTKRLARIRAGFDMDGILWGRDGQIIRVEKVQYYTKYGFIPSPDSVVYDLGFGHLLYPMNEAINTSMNQMFDAGHLANVGGGFVGSGLSVNSGAMRFAMGEYKPVNVIGGSIRDNIYTMEFPGPSQVLLALLQFLVEAAERVAAVKDVMVGDMPGDNTSGITTLAVIEQGLKVFSAIYKRIYRSLGYEFKKLYRLNRLYMPNVQGFGGASDGWEEVKRQDYMLGSGVEPISDPQMVTDMQRLGRAQFLLGFKDDPACNGMAIRAEAFTAAMIAQPERFLAQNPSPPPQVALKSRELDIREKREMADLQLRAAHDHAMMVREIAQAELYLAQARKLDNDAQIDWVEQHIARLKVEVDALGTIGDLQNQVADSGNGGNGGSGSDAGTNGGAMGPVAAPSGNGTGP